MITFFLQLMGATFVGCIHGAVSAYLFCYLEIVQHWDPFLLSVIFGTHGTFFALRRSKLSKERIMRVAAACKS
jgi:hypothetical protein